MPGAAFTEVTCADDRGRAHECKLADTTITLDITEGPRKGQQVSLRQVTRREPASRGATRQAHTLTSRDDLPAGEVCWRMSSRWREENYFRYARTHFALDALDSYAAAPVDPVGLDYWIWPGRLNRLGSSLSDLLGCLPSGPRDRRRPR